MKKCKYNKEGLCKKYKEPCEFGDVTKCSEAKLIGGIQPRKMVILDLDSTDGEEIQNLEQFLEDNNWNYYLDDMKKIKCPQCYGLNKDFKGFEFIQLNKKWTGEKMINFKEIIKYYNLDTDESLSLYYSYFADKISIKKAWALVYCIIVASAILELFKSEQVRRWNR
jgi:hypothetical protein